MAKIQRQGIKTDTEIIAAGGTIANLPGDDQMYISANSINKTLRQAIIDGDIAGGSSSLDTVAQVTGKDLASTFSTGNNVVPLGGGTLAGTFVRNTVNPLNGDADYIYTQAAGSLNDYVFTKLLTVPEKFRGKQVAVKFAYKYNGNDNDLQAFIRDVTNSSFLGEDLFIPASSSTISIYKATISIPQTCTQLRVGFQVKVLNSGKILEVDDFDLELVKDVELSSPVLVQEVDSFIRLRGTNGYGSTATKIPRLLTLETSRGSDVTYADSAINGSSFTINTAGVYEINFSADSVSACQFGLSVNSTQLTTNINAINGVNTLAYDNGGAGDGGHVSYSGYFNAGDVIRPHTNGAAISYIYNFSIAKQGKLRIVNASTNNKIDLPATYLRLEGSSTRGATDTAIVRFDTTARLVGDGVVVSNDANLGTVITVQKKGKLDIQVNLLTSGVTQITRNQVTRTAISSTASEILSTENLGGALGSFSWSGDVLPGDQIRVASGANPTAGVGNSLNLSFVESAIQVSVSNMLPQFSESDSSVRVNTANGFGSTATRIQRFSNLESNIGTSITYSDSATNGASFVINENGIYNITFVRNPISDSRWGISRNASSLTANLESLTANEILSVVRSDAANNDVVASWSGYLNQGDVIRPHTDGIASANTSRHSFTISKVGKPNVTGVDVTPFTRVPTYNATKWESYVPVVTGLGTGSGTASGRWRRNGDSVEIRFRFQKDGSAGSGTTAVTFSIPPQLNVDTTKLPGLSNVAASGYASSNGIEGAANNFITSTVLNAQYLGNANAFSISNPGAGGNAEYNGSDFRANATVDGYVSFPIQGWEAFDLSTAVETDQFSTDTNVLTYAGSATYTLSTLANAPIGTFITWTYAANTNTATQTNASAPTQTTSDMNTNGIRVYPRAFNAASTAAQPARFAIQIGKGLKGVALRGYSAIGKVGQVALDNLVVGNTERGISQSYNENTGVLIIDAGLANTGTSTARDFIDNDAVNTTSVCYVVINAAKTPDVSVIARNTSPLLVAFKNGGSATANTTIASWTGVEADTTNSFNLSTGVYTVPQAGTYEITFHAGTDVSSGVVRIHKNGSAIARGMSNADTFDFVTRVAPNLVVGDQITVQYDVTRTFNANNFDTILTIRRL